MSRNSILLGTLCMAVGCALTTGANAEVVTLRIFDHFDGNAGPPLYVLRVDGLFTGDSDDIYTYEALDLSMDVDTVAESAHIKGTLFGGLNDGPVYATDGSTPANSLAGQWQLDFLYDDGVSIATENSTLYGDRLVVTVDEDADNSGTLELLDAIDVDDEDGDDDATTDTDEGKIINLVDYMGFIFRSDLHRFRTDATSNFADFGGFDVKNSGEDHCLIAPLDEECKRWSGRGWLNHGIDFFAVVDDDSRSHISASDFLFTGEVVPVPEPGAIALLGLGLAGLALGKRRSKNPA